jgi:hypothetical protein
MKKNKHERLVVIGGGAAGFFCAVNAAELNPELDVMLLEKSGKLLSKVKISGGGRCNVTHYCDSRSLMLDAYPRGKPMLKQAFRHFFTSDTVDWFTRHGVSLKTEADGRMFPTTDDSQTIIDCLLSRVRELKIRIQLFSEPTDLQSLGSRWKIQLRSGDSLEADHVCIATGGHPKSAGYDWIRRLGHRIVEPVPSLFTFNMPDNPVTRLQGVSVPSVRASIRGTGVTSEGPLLITHWGMSGPAILKLSALAARELAAKNWQFVVAINWLPTYHEQRFKEKLQEYRFALASKMMSTGCPENLPTRLWNQLLQDAGIPENTRWSDMTAKAQNKLARCCCNQEYAVSGKTTFKEEFVTAGGVTWEEVDSNTMESKLARGIYFAGEVLDADGITGGYNFQQAWTTGFIAAKAIASAGRNK